jgi:hypothetical protein
LCTAAHDATWPTGGRVPEVAGESADERRARLRDLVLDRGKRLLANICSAQSHAEYRDAFIALGNQRVADAGCSSDFRCLEKNGPPTASKLYTTSKDRQISKQYISLVNQGGVSLGELGAFMVLVGHPQDAADMNNMAIPLLPLDRCKGANAGSNG